MSEASKPQPRTLREAVEMYDMGHVPEEIDTPDTNSPSEEALEGLAHEVFRGVVVLAAHDAWQSLPDHDHDAAQSGGSTQQPAAEITRHTEEIV